MEIKKNYWEIWEREIQILIRIYFDFHRVGND